MSEDDVQFPEDPQPTADAQNDKQEPPPYAPDFELIGYLEERDGAAPARRRS